jgi:predicted RNA-binding Zn-ribbon protein involved in translation (DUF1610 family)
MKCPDCGERMRRAGFLYWWKQKVKQKAQRYQCIACGRTTVKGGNDEG